MFILKDLIARFYLSGLLENKIQPFKERTVGRKRVNLPHLCQGQKERITTNKINPKL